jgi:hypothetical protein
VWISAQPVSRFAPPEAWATVHDSACASGITASEITKLTRPQTEVNQPRPWVMGQFEGQCEEYGWTRRSMRIVRK